MSQLTITLPVDATTAQRYAAASPGERQKMHVLLRLRLREYVDMPPQSLQAVMDEIGANAHARGLTPEILEDLLRDD